MIYKPVPQWAWAHRHFSAIIPGRTCFTSFHRVADWSAQKLRLPIEGHSGLELVVLRVVISDLADKPDNTVRDRSA